jgi:hypothetical protein
MSLSNILTTNAPTGAAEPWKDFTVYNLTVTNQFVGPTGPGGINGNDHTITCNLTGAIGVTGYIYHVSSITVDDVTQVSLHLPANIQANAAADTIQFSEGIPEGLWPIASSQVFYPIIVLDNSLNSLGHILINPSNGAIIICRLIDDGSPFTNSGNCGLPADVFVSWDLSSNV